MIFRSLNFSFEQELVLSTYWSIIPRKGLTFKVREIPVLPQIVLCDTFRGAFNILSNVYDGAFCEII